VHGLKHGENRACIRDAPEICVSTMRGLMRLPQSMTLTILVTRHLAGLGVDLDLGARSAHHPETA